MILVVLASVALALLAWMICTPFRGDFHDGLLLEKPLEDLLQAPEEGDVEKTYSGDVLLSQPRQAPLPTPCGESAHRRPVVVSPRLRQVAGGQPATKRGFAGYAIHRDAAQRPSRSGRHPPL